MKKRVLLVDERATERRPFRVEPWCDRAARKVKHPSTISRRDGKRARDARVVPTVFDPSVAKKLGLEPHEPRVRPTGHRHELADSEAERIAVGRHERGFRRRHEIVERRARAVSRAKLFDAVAAIELLREPNDAAGERGIEPLDVSVPAHRAPKAANHRHVAGVGVVRRGLEIGQVPTNLRRRHRREIVAEHRANPIDGRRVELGPIARSRSRYTEESGNALTDPHLWKNYDACDLHASSNAVAATVAQPR